ncbi:nucleotide exchange factor GrpE [Pediococcus acidilactici]|jgi:molecular chaperone GrpE|uniref:nucleotide exchange factor GrpE n=1 Tax=Pediococcus acidilactici TaxID=1254 RepID=UPI00056B7155|nr:nucleotide exchange factor GrpE [Pediococcus acidilactici]APR28390.1 nucleotide exchange factor GrpE [Pediococcus acidilactici]KAF0335512.1 nucleotide exchange factor GrpE [Pediococcus acidilactici]KAF0336226.1 nucleotide exchange factor GrpE [Pediococcus acidilactici]KAF0338534.1 nucleotide exchange factor GrpE [Pediococcus acidilactici]KAF0341008.1 nucleotide exchange factor GrpE [Pediococcus acidilactici]
MTVRRIELAKEDEKAKSASTEAKVEEESKGADKQAKATSQDEKNNQKDSAKDSKQTTLDPAEIEKITAERDELSDKYIRAQAEIVNMRRRNEKEQASLLKYDGQKLAKAILPALDNLERALTVEAEHSEQLLKGVEMVQKDLLKALKENDIAEIEADGQKFDPNLHQAVQTVPADDDHPADTVVKVFQKGYILKDRVLRPAMVVVAQ